MNKAKNQVLSLLEKLFIYFFYVEGLSSPGIHTSLSISKCVTGLSLSSSKGAWIENRHKLLAGISVPLNKVRVLLIKIWSRA